MLVCLLYAQFSRQTSLRDLVLALETKKRFLYYLCGTDSIWRSTMADANERRPYQVFESLFMALYQQCIVQAPRP